MKIKINLENRISDITVKGSIEIDDGLKGSDLNVDILRTVVDEMKIVLGENREE